jgi:hypothetical protein
MDVVTAYLDASGHPDNTDVLVVAGLVLTSEQWVNFEREWEECLAEFHVSALHMKHFAHSLKEFSGWDQDEPKRKRFLNGLLWVIENHVLNGSPPGYAVAHCVYMHDYRRVDSNRLLSETMRPYSMAALTCAGRIISWAESVGHNRNEIIYVFEHGDADQGDLRRLWDVAYPHQEVQPLIKKKTDVNPDATSRRIRAFEAADLLAYEFHKSTLAVRQKGGEIYFDEQRKPAQRLSALPGYQTWGLVEEHQMYQLCDLCNVPNRPVTTPPA